MSDVDGDLEGDLDTDVSSDVADDPNAVPAATAISVLDLLVSALVDAPEAVRIAPIPHRDRTRL